MPSCSLASAHAIWLCKVALQSKCCVCLSQDIDNCIAAVQECLPLWTGTETPTISHFIALQPGMVTAVESVHFKGTGGWRAFMKRCDLTPLRLESGFWTVEQVDKSLQDFVSTTDKPGVMPTQSDLRRARAHSLSGAISKRGGCETLSKTLMSTYLQLSAFLATHWFLLHHIAVLTTNTCTTCETITRMPLVCRGWLSCDSSKVEPTVAGL